MEFDTVLLSALIPAIIVMITMCLLSCLKCGRRNHNSIIRGRPTDSTTIYTVPANYSTVSSNSPTAPVNQVPVSSTTWSAGHHRISSIGDRFAVPLDLLPPHFDFNTPGVEHKGDYVLIKDLKLIQVPTQTEFQKQLPYNPDYNPNFS